MTFSQSVDTKQEPSIPWKSGGRLLRPWQQRCTAGRGRPADGASGSSGCAGGFGTGEV